MTEPTDNLESRLSSLRPRSIDSSLEERIARSTTTTPTGTAVSLFWTTVAGGAIAASTILVLLTTQSARPGPLPSTGLAVVNPPKSPAGVALASADWRWGDELNFNQTVRHP